MAMNEIFKHSDWIALPVVEGTVNGSPVLVGTGLVGVAQVVGGTTQSYEIAGVTYSFTETSTSLEPGWASVALTGAWAFEITGTDAATIGAVVYITQGTGGNPATVSFSSAGADAQFGHLIAKTTDGRAVVRIQGGAI